MQPDCLPNPAFANSRIKGVEPWLPHETILRPPFTKRGAHTTDGRFHVKPKGSPALVAHQAQRRALPLTVRAPFDPDWNAHRLGGPTAQPTMISKLNIGPVEDVRCEGGYLTSRCRGLATPMQCRDRPRSGQRRHPIHARVLPTYPGALFGHDISGLAKTEY